MEINKYYNSKIYKIVSNYTDKIYIGSTSQILSKRIYAHRKTYQYYYDNNKGNYITSYELIKLGEIDIILIENYKCENREELKSRERYYIELNKEICVNKNIPSRTIKEYYIDNIEKIKEQKKIYVREDKHKEKINCECGGKYIKSNKVHHLKTKKHLKNIIISL